MKKLAERVVKMAIWAYRMHPHDFDLQVVVRNAEAILAKWQSDMRDSRAIVYGMEKPANGRRC